MEIRRVRVRSEGKTRQERVTETQSNDGVGKQQRVLLTGVAIDLIDQVANVLLGEKAVDDIERNLVVLWQAFANQHATRRGFEPLHILIAALVRLGHAAHDLAV